MSLKAIKHVKSTYFVNLRFNYLLTAWMIETYRCIRLFLPDASQRRVCFSTGSRPHQIIGPEELNESSIRQKGWARQINFSDDGTSLAYSFAKIYESQAVGRSVATFSVGRARAKACCAINVVTRRNPDNSRRTFEREKKVISSIAKNIHQGPFRIHVSPSIELDRITLASSGVWQ